LYNDDFILVDHTILSPPVERETDSIEVQLVSPEYAALYNKDRLLSNKRIEEDVSRLFFIALLQSDFDSASLLLLGSGIPAAIDPEHKYHCKLTRSIDDAQFHIQNLQIRTRLRQLQAEYLNQFKGVPKKEVNLSLINIHLTSKFNNSFFDTYLRSITNSFYQQHVEMYWTPIDGVEFSYAEKSEINRSVLNGLTYVTPNPIETYEQLQQFIEQVEQLAEETGNKVHSSINSDLLPLLEQMQAIEINSFTKRSNALRALIKRSRLQLNIRKLLSKRDQGNTLSEEAKALDIHLFNLCKAVKSGALLRGERAESSMKSIMDLLSEMVDIAPSEPIDMQATIKIFRTVADDLQKKVPHQPRNIEENLLKKIIHKNSRAFYSVISELMDVGYDLPEELITAQDQLGNCLLHHLANQDIFGLIIKINERYPSQHWLTQIRNQRNLTTMNLLTRKMGGLRSIDDVVKLKNMMKGGKTTHSNPLSTQEKHLLTIVLGSLSDEKQSPIEHATAKSESVSLNSPLQRQALALSLGCLLEFARQQQLPSLDLIYAVSQGTYIYKKDCQKFKLIIDAAMLSYFQDNDTILKDCLQQNLGITASRLSLRLVSQPVHALFLELYENAIADPGFSLNIHDKLTAAQLNYIADQTSRREQAERLAVQERLKNEVAKKNALEAQRLTQEAQKNAQEAQKREQESQKREQEAQKREQESQRNAQEAQKREQEAQKREQEAQKREQEARQEINMLKRQLAERERSSAGTLSHSLSQQGVFSASTATASANATEPDKVAILQS